MEKAEIFCPGKVNLYLAVTGRRADGYHELVSLVAPVAVGDRLVVRRREGDGIELSCVEPGIPVDSGNLVVRAAELFRERFPFSGGLVIELEKNLPAGAGLGGGSSDAAGLLIGLNQLLGGPMDRAELCELAAAIGSDCPFFLEGGASVLRGRGERVEPLPEAVRERLRGLRLLLMKPSFPIGTAWAYEALAGSEGGYCSVEEAESRLEGWLGGELPVSELFFNSFERAVFRKFIPLKALKVRLEREAGVPVLMSGSGSTLFAVVGEGDIGKVRELARDALGEAGWIVETELL